jgi:hypothetical protein
VKLQEVSRRTVGQSPVGLVPHIFSRVEFRGIGWELFDLESWMVSDPLLDLAAAMDCSPIPQQDHGSPKVPEQVLKERSDIQSREIARAKLKVKGQPSSLGRDRQGADRRDPVLFVEIVHQGCFAFWGPGAGHVGDEQEARFIEEEQMGAKLVGVFLYAARGTVSTARSPLRPVAGPDAPVSGNSTPCLEVTARHGWGGTECETAGRSIGRSVSRSTDRCDGQKPGGPLKEALPAVASESWTTWADGRGSVWVAARRAPSFCRRCTIGRPNSWRRLRPAPRPTGVFRLSTTGWPVGVAVPVVAGSRGVS